MYVCNSLWYFSFVHSDTRKNVGADRVKELGQVHDEYTVGVQAWTSLETSKGIGDALDTWQRPKVQMPQNQTWKVRAAIIVYRVVLQSAIFGTGSTGSIRINLSSQILNRERVSQGWKSLKILDLKRENQYLKICIEPITCFWRVFAHIDVLVHNHVFWSYEYVNY